MTTTKFHVLVVRFKKKMHNSNPVTKMHARHGSISFALKCQYWGLLNKNLRRQNAEEPSSKGTFQNLGNPFRLKNFRPQV